MNSLAIEALLKVDEDDSPRKSLKRISTGSGLELDAADRGAATDAQTSRPVLSRSVPLVRSQSNEEPMETREKEAGIDWSGTKVVKSYPINRWCAAQVLWDGGAGQYRYELVEPRLSPAERRTFEGIVAQLHRKPRSALAEMRRVGGRERILQRFELLCREQGISGDPREKMAYFLERDFWGYKKIHGLLLDPNIEDVSCNGYRMPVYAYLPGFESVPTNVGFASEEELDDFAMYLVQKGGKSISAASPIQDVVLPDGSRLNVTLYREVSSNGTTFSIRLAGRAKGAAELLRHGTFSPEALAFLWLAMENRCSMTFIGGTASGKTAALNAVSSFIAERNKVVTIEDTREVRLASQNWTPLVTREAGDAPITEFDLLVTAFRQRPEYVIVGEVRTPEGARAAIHGINSGHTVIMTFHADSPSSFFGRLTNEPFNISPRVAAGMSLCVNLSMVTIAAAGSDMKVRRCRSICEVAGVEDGRLIVNPLFEWDPAADTLLTTPERSAVVQKIREERGWSERRVIEELAHRTMVLRWLAGHAIAGEGDLRRLVEEFYRNRSGLLEKMRAGAPMEPAGRAGDEAA